MNNLELIKQYALETWRKSDQTTKLSFSDETKRYGNCSYNKVEHLVHICPGFIIVDHEKYFSDVLSLEAFAKMVVAHELGHSSDLSTDYLDASHQLMLAVVNDNQEAIDSCRETIFQKKLQQEIVAWKNARLFLDSYNKEAFYKVVRNYLDLYIKNKNDDFESLFSFFSSMKTDSMMKRFYLDIRENGYTQTVS